MALFTTRLIKSKPLTVNTTKPWSPIGLIKSKPLTINTTKPWSPIGLNKSKPLTINTTKPWSPIGTNVQIDYSNNKNKHLELSSSLKDAKTRTHLIGKKKKKT